MGKLQLIQITEGSAKLLVPKASFQDPFHLPVFYNPAMRFNRSVSSLALGCGLPLLEDSVIVDGLCALGARGIRYAKENKLKKIYFVDANPDAIKVLKRNIKLNKLKNCKIVENDLNKFFLNSEEHFDFIEIDPFGSPVYFLQNAIRRLKKKSILSITATDLANLAGANPAACIKHYGARPQRTEYGHETALRILVGKIARELMMQDFGCKPLLSFYKGHALKTVIHCEKSAENADAAISNLGFISHCPSCLNREISSKQKEKCPNCGKEYAHAGPLWMGPLQSETFLQCLRGANANSSYEDKIEIEKLLSMLGEEERFPPTFYDLHVLARKHKLKILKMEKVIALMEKAGFRAARTHYAPTAIKTDAPYLRLLKILKSK